MIDFDNGPAGGDYARYIDALLTSRAALPLLANSAFGEGIDNTTAQPPQGAQRAQARVNALMNASGATRTASTLSAAQAAAISSALMNSGRTVTTSAWRWIVAAIGAVLLLAGLLVGAFNAGLVAAGAVLLFAAVGRTRAARPTDPRATRRTTRA